MCAPGLPPIENISESLVGDPIVDAISKSLC